MLQKCALLELQHKAVLRNTLDPDSDFWPDPDSMTMDPKHCSPQHYLWRWKDSLSLSGRAMVGSPPPPRFGDFLSLPLIYHFNYSKISKTINTRYRYYLYWREDNWYLYTGLIMLLIVAVLIMLLIVALLIMLLIVAVLRIRIKIICIQDPTRTCCMDSERNLSNI